jgi:hypothetical protein
MIHRMRMPVMPLSTQAPPTRKTQPAVPGRHGNNNGESMT